MGHMMDSMGGGAMWGMGLIGVLVLVLLVLGVAALIKYLFFAVALAVLVGTGLLLTPAVAQQPDAQRGELRGYRSDMPAFAGKLSDDDIWPCSPTSKARGRQRSGRGRFG